MLILLDCRPLQYAGFGLTNERSRFILSAAALLTAEQGVEWLYLVDQSYKPGDFPGVPEVNSSLQPVLRGSMGLSATVTIPGTRLLVRRAFPGWTGWRIWYDGQIPRLAKKYRADLVMTTGGIAAASMRIPQVIWMPESANGQERKREKRGKGRAIKEESFYIARLAESLFRAATIFCFSQKDKTFLSGQTSGPVEDKIVILPPAPDEGAAPLSPEEKETAKTAYAGGKEYFLAIVPPAGQQDDLGMQEGIVNLLKAFSLFKKRQMSNMQLVLVGQAPGADKDLTEKLATYKYRQDVYLFDDPAGEDRARVMAAAYAVLFPFAGESLGTGLLSAWQAGVPVIVLSGGRMQEMAGEAALYGSPETPILLAGQLMLLYKDESLCHGLIEKGRERLRSFNEEWPVSGERPVDRVWAGIRRAVTGIIN